MAKKGRRKHIPQRTCVVCRRTFPKRELNRIVRGPEGDVHVDPTGKAPGRGAYLCNDLACWEKAATGSFLDRALKTSLTPAQRAALQAELERRKALLAQTSDNG
ncbi:MAG TPA: YlxR family protein [Anaerolineae bacterium]|nr:YlxR family protein [Caldilineae bacterium]HID33715.1 YlxR family protein [Anaerolineae bacterium]